MIGASVAAFAALTATFSSPATAASNRTLTGAAIGTGAVVAGSPGAVVGGPRIGGSERVCWRDRHNRKHCRWR